MVIGRTDVEAEAPILWPPDGKNWLILKDPDAGKDWGQEEKGITGWEGWMASLTQWIWVSVDSRSWWWTGRPGVLQFMGWGSQRVGHDWATELNFVTTRINLIIRVRWANQEWSKAVELKLWWQNWEDSHHHQLFYLTLLQYLCQGGLYNFPALSCVSCPLRSNVYIYSYLF